MQPPVAGIQERRVTTWLNTPFDIGFRLIDTLTVRFDVSEDHSDRSVFLLGLWPSSLLPVVPTWQRLAEHAIWQPSTYWGFGHSHHRATPLPLSGCRGAGSMSWTGVASPGRTPQPNTRRLSPAGGAAVVPPAGRRSKYS